MTYILFATAFSALSTTILLLVCVRSAQISRNEEGHANAARRSPYANGPLSQSIFGPPPSFQHER